MLDIEGEILKRLRAAVGSDLPIVASLDLHANMSETMVENATALLGVNHYPHSDTYEHGEEAMEMLVQIVEQISWGLIPHAQAILLARFIRGDLDEYPPFLWK